MKSTVLSRAVLFSLFFLFLLIVPSQANPNSVDNISLLLIPAEQLSTKELILTLPRYIEPVAYLNGTAGNYLLATVQQENVPQLLGTQPSWQLLDGSLSDEYYLVHGLVGNKEPEWSRYGRILHNDGQQVLLKTTSAQIEQLAQLPVFLSRLTLDPISTPTPRTTTAFPPVTTPDPIVQAMIEQIESDDIVDTLSGLSGEWPVQIGGTPYTLVTRNTYSGEPVEKATQYVGERMAGLGLGVTYPIWQNGRPPNVIGEIEGQSTPDDVFIISAHLDNMPYGALAPGADDNGSGSTAVLTAAELLSQYQWDCTLRFALWTGEEQGLLGSDAYAANATAEGENIVGVLNLDMIGYNGSAPPIIDLHAHSGITDSVDMANQFASVVSTYQLDLQPDILIDNYLGNYSDNKSFWDEGYASILAIEDYSDFTPYYHTTQDVLSTLDIDYFTDFVQAGVGTFAHMAGCLTSGQNPLPHAPDVSIELLDHTVELSWPHKSANVAYEVHRADNPYFTPDSGTRLTTLEPPFATIVAYEDLSVAVGNSELNHYYVVVAQNAVADEAISNRVGEFDFGDEITPVYGYTVLNEYPHDDNAFTQGLVYEDGYFFEGTGLTGQSSLRKVELATGTVLQQHNLDSQYFGEGIAVWGGEIIQLTWQNQVAFVYDKATFVEQSQFNYSTQGWGLTQDGVQLIMSDGSANLYFRDPLTFAELDQVVVHDRGEPVIRLNELEYINGEVYANVWITDLIARIDPQTGRVLGWIDLTGILQPEDQTPQTDVLNGIAYDDAGNGRLFVTGKRWSKLFHIELVPSS